MNIFGNRFRITIFGESHGASVGVVMDGVRAGLALSEGDFVTDLGRRQSGAEGTTARREPDHPEILSGVYDGVTTGAPLTVMFRNEDVLSADYEQFRCHPRPSHVDFVAAKKFNGFNDPRGGGHFSGRLTVTLVAAGVVAKKMLGEEGVEIDARVVETGDIEMAKATGDSVGGVVECVVAGLPVGLGEPFFDSVESLVAHILFSIPGVKGVEFGAGFAAAKMLGSGHNDLIISESGETETNHAGGVNGGLTNGNPLVVRVAVKPASSISCVQMTYDFSKGSVEPLSIGGRHDSCIALRVPVVVEAAVSIALMQLYN